MLASRSSHTALLMGDSAGAGYALAVTEVLASEGRRPQAVLISPYGDAVASDPRTDEYDKRDPYLAPVGVRTALKAWRETTTPSAHVYPLMPIPEAKRAIQTIIDFVATTAAQNA